MAGFDGNGNYVRPYNWTNDAANAIPITASRFDTDGDDVAAAFGLCLTRDNQGKPTAPLSWAQPLTIKNITVSGGTVDTPGITLSDAGAQISIARSGDGAARFFLGTDIVGGSAFSIKNTGGLSAELQLTGGTVVLKTATNTCATIDGTGIFSINAATAGPSLIVSANNSVQSHGNLRTGLAFTTTANFGIFAGTDVPSLAAAQGSLYLRANGASGTTRLYVASDSAGTWVAVNTVS